MPKKKYTKDFLQPIVSECKSVNELLTRIGLSHTGGNFAHMYKVLKREKVDISTFRGQAWRKGKSFPGKYHISVYLNNEKGISSSYLKQRLLKEKYFENKCYSCNNTEWMGYPIQLELHHKDNNHENNSLDNLTILCPNCHALVHKLDRNSHHKIRKFSKVSKNPRFKNPESKDGRAKPRFDLRKCKRPGYSQLLIEVNDLGYTNTGKKYGVSDNAIRKWLKIYEKYGEVPPN